MSKSKKKKLCWNCEGNVAVDGENCPYCGVYVGSEDVHTPPYTQVKSDSSQEVPLAPYAVHDDTSAEAVIEETSDKSASEHSLNVLKMIVLPLVLLLFGSVFLLFGIALLLFSHHGMLTLRWDGSYWYLYLLLGLPMLFFGWLALRKVVEE